MSRLDDFYIVAVSGDRDWHPYTLMRREITRLQKRHKKLLVISGGQRGVDLVCRDVCLEMGQMFCELPAAWTFFQRRAGPIRNSWILLFKPDEVLAFHPNIENSKGTKNMIEQSKRLGIRVKEIKS